MKQLKGNVKIWIELGVSNNQRFINISKLHQSLGRSVSRGLPGFHALTGCDYNPALFRKGKKLPLNIFINSRKYQKAFSDLGDLNANIFSIFKLLEEFICEIYGFKELKHVDDVSYAIFEKAYYHKKQFKV